MGGGCSTAALVPATAASIGGGGGGGRAGAVTGTCGGGGGGGGGGGNRGVALDAARVSPGAGEPLLRAAVSFSGLVIQGDAGGCTLAAGAGRAAPCAMDTLRRVALARAANRTLLYTSTASTAKNSTMQPTMTRATT